VVKGSAKDRVAIAHEERERSVLADTFDDLLGRPRGVWMRSLVLSGYQIG
jgi:hypothetical protein